MSLQKAFFRLLVSAGIYLLKVNNKNTRTRCEVCSKLVNFEQYFTPCCSVSIVNFEHVIAGWGIDRKIVHK